MNISEDFINHTTAALEKHEEHITCTYEERDAALIRLYQNIHSKDQIKTTLGRKYKSNLSDLLTLCNSLKYMFFKPEAVLPLATTGSLSETFGNAMKVSRVIDLACKIGLLEEVNGKYSYCSATTTSIHFKPNAKEYVCNREVIKVIEEISKEENIEVSKEDTIQNVSIYNNTVANTFATNAKEYVCNREVIKKIEEISKEDTIQNVSIYNNTVVDTFAINKDYSVTSKTLINDTDENVLTGLYNHYSYIKHFQELADKLNNTEVLNPLETIKFKFNITRGDSGKVTKIGIRATNKIVSFKEHENENENFKGTWRKDYMTAVLGEGYEEYDVHSSISNVNYLLNHGKWLGIDCYRPEFGQEWNETTTRAWYKNIFMKLYFNESEEAAAKSIISDDKEYRYSDDCKDIIHTLKENMYKFLGKTYGSEIFLHESCIYLLVREKLMKCGIKCSQVYDGFYFKKGEMPEDMDSIVRECAMEYYTKYYMENNKMEEDWIKTHPEAFLRFVEKSKEGGKLIAPEDLGEETYTGEENEKEEKEQNNDRE